MGENTLNSYFYKPALGASGGAEKALFDAKLDIADAEIKANKDAKHTQNTDTDLDATFEATIAKKADKLSAFAATTSAELAGVISDETGTDKLVYNTSPTLVTPILGVAAATSINLTGGQIAFPATAVPSAGANTLDDYEEGTWTMGVSFGGGTTGITYQEGFITGFYTKIGNLVSISGYCVLTSKGSSTGEARITGLPFTVANNIAGYAPATLVLRYITFANQFMGHASINSTAVDLFEVTEAGALTTLTDADFANNSTFMVSCTYRIE